MENTSSVPSTEPQNPTEILKGSKQMPSSGSSYLVQRKYLNMPDPDFRVKFETDEEQNRVFQDFHITYVVIEDPSGTTSLEVDVLIPKKVLTGEAWGTLPMHVRFHGGGFVSLRIPVCLQV
jgi:hypothetical protein